jgi:hypothetical protein
VNLAVCRFAEDIHHRSDHVGVMDDDSSESWRRDPRWEPPLPRF